MAYSRETRSIVVSVEPQFVEEQSSPKEGVFFWAYTVDIRNQGIDTVRLRSRYWKITDGNGRVQEVRGRGVVGEQPVLASGGHFQYTSGCPLGTPSGIMVGTYTMENPDGTIFDVEIPAFSLDSPHARRVLN